MLNEFFKIMEDEWRNLGEKHTFLKGIDFKAALIIVIFLIFTFTRWLSVPLIAAIVIFLSVKRNHGQNEANSDKESCFDTEPKRPDRNAKPPERYDSDPDREHIKSKSFTDYPNSVDPWDVKDDKPPWEL